MEGICMNINSVFKAVRELVGEPKSVTATGGFAQSAVWKQMLADVLNCPVEIPQSFESGCLAAVVMAMKSIGQVKDLAIVDKFIGDKETYQPDAAIAAVYQQYQPVFEQVVTLLSPLYGRITDLQQANS